MANKKKRCLFCKDYHVAEEGIKTPAGFFCSLDHAVKHSIAVQERQRKRQREREAKEQRKKERERKQALRPKSWYLKEAQKWFNKFIRLRDSMEPCISCGRYHQGQYHAGHYKTVGAAPEIRFEELNCHKQCAPCNNHLSGNIVNYRQNLIKKIGIDKVEWLEGQHEPAKYTIEELKKLIMEYKKKCKTCEDNT